MPVTSLDDVCLLNGFLQDEVRAGRSPNPPWYAGLQMPLIKFGYEMKDIQLVLEGVRRILGASLGEEATHNKALETYGQLFCRFNQLEVLGYELGIFRAYGFHAFAHLRVLKVSGDLAWLPSDMRVLTNLQVLSVENVKLTSLHDSIALMTALIELNVDRNCIDCLLPGVDNLTALERLHCSSNQLRSLPEGVCKLDSLAELCLGKNLLTSLPNTIASMAKLSRLELCSNPSFAAPISLPFPPNSHIRLLDLRSDGCVSVGCTAPSRCAVFCDRNDTVIVTCNLEVPRVVPRLCRSKQLPTWLKGSILVVGNGKVDDALGHRIQEFDTVVRFNGKFKSCEYATHLFVSDFRAQMDNYFGESEEKLRGHPENHNITILGCSVTIRCFESYIASNPTSIFTSVQFVPLLKLGGGDIKLPYAADLSSGFRLIYALLEIFDVPSIDIVGFEHAGDRFHNWNYEARYMNQQVEAGRIRRLD